ncbi:MAG: sulfurtransferase TusA family protein [Gammaproteobacteria bacterium]|nr:sulfurtransferase TusA family protein [Gammaproteobacteria bacterium]
MSIEVNRELDASGLACPLPILRLKQALSQMVSGERVRVVTTDPGSKLDFPSFAKQTGHHLLDAQEASGKYYYIVEKA